MDEGLRWSVVRADWPDTTSRGSHGAETSPDLTEVMMIINVPVMNAEARGQTVTGGERQRGILMLVGVQSGCSASKLPQVGGDLQSNIGLTRI